MNDLTEKDSKKSRRKVRINLSSKEYLFFSFKASKCWCKISEPPPEWLSPVGEA